MSNIIKPKIIKQLPTTTFRFIFHFAKLQSTRFMLLMSAFMLMASNDSLFPYFLKRIVNAVQAYHGAMAGIYSAVSVPLILVILFWGVSEFAMRSQGILQIYTFPKFRANIREAVFNHVKLHSHEYFSNNFAGNIAKKLSDLPQSCQSIIEFTCFNLIIVSVGSLIVLITMWFVKPVFALILIIWMIIHLCIILTFFKKCNIAAEIHSEAITELSGKTVDVFTNMQNVRLFSRAPYEAEYLKTYQQDEIKKAKKALWVIEKMRIGLAFNGLFLMFTMIFVLLFGWQHHWVSIGDFTQVLMQSFWLMGNFWFLSFQMTMVTRELGTIDNALLLIRHNYDLVDKIEAKPIKISHGAIEFKQVEFAYKNNVTVFKNLNVVIPAGQKIGLVGFSGSGKSTFVNLVLRFYDLQAGKILIDGVNIADVLQDSLRAQIAMIPQDPALFHRTLMENIRYGRLDASDDEVIAASKLAHCHEFIEKLDQGYHSLVGERGIKLSGGQRQRIAIARAILKNAPILILDEATSSLDSVTEKLIQDSLQHLMQGRTTIVVAHRLSTLSDMDRIIVFSKGEIIEDDTIENLLKSNGHFAMLWNMQTDGYLPMSGS